jgi:hypothetical protein
VSSTAVRFGEARPSRRHLAVVVQVSDWSGSALVDPDAGSGLADAIVDLVPGVVPTR